MPPPKLEVISGGGQEQHFSRGGSDGGDDLKERLARLETHFEYIRADLDEIKRSTAVLPELPTRKDLWAWKIQWTAISVAAIGLIIGGVIGGLAWIKPEPTPPAPIIIQTPLQPVAPNK